jgi:guanylate kinase
VDRPKFQSLVDQDSLLEWAEVHGNYYGTSREFVDDLMKEGYDVLLDIDVQGADIIRGKRPDSIGVFILPPSYQVLHERLVRRSLDPGFVIEQRLKKACKEISHFSEYDYVIINEDLGSSIRELESIILSARCRIAARIKSANSVVATFGGMDAEDP